MNLEDAPSRDAGDPAVRLRRRIALTPRASLLGVTLALTAMPAEAREPSDASETRTDLPPSSAREPSAAERPGPTPTPDAAQPQIVPPKLLSFVEATYPPEAEAAGTTGDVVLSLLVGADGAVSEVAVLEPAGHGFDEAAREAALKFRFSPALVDGRPAAVRIPFKYSFTLTEQEPDEPPPPTLGELGGQLKIAGMELPLAGAIITLTPETGEPRNATSDAAGRWTAGELEPGTYRVRVEAAGFDPIEARETVVAGELTELTYRASPVATDAVRVNVRAKRPPREVVRRTISRREMTKVPGTSGDALRGVQNLPGLARPPGLAGLLIVRGSAPQDTGVFVEGDLIPFIYHFGGLSSAIPTELLDSIDFYPGNFSSRYGRVMGGIVEVSLRKPDEQCTGDYAAPSSGTGCYHGLAQVDLIDGRALLQGPLPVDGWTFAIAGRRSWVDAWLGPALEEAGANVTTAPVYHDYQLIVESPQTGDSRVSFRVFGSDDALELLIENPSSQDPGTLGGGVSFATSFIRAQALIEQQLSQEVSLRSMLSLGRDKVEFNLGRFRFDVESYPIQMRNEFEWSFARGMTLHAGLDFQVVPIDLLVRLPEPPRPGEAAPGPFATRPLLETIQNTTFFRPAWYLDAQLRVGPDLMLTPGVRVDYARDTSHGDFSPRLTARYDLTKSGVKPDGTLSRRTTLKAGAGLFHQPPTPQETDEVFGSPGLHSNRAAHYSLGCTATGRLTTPWASSAS